MTKLRKYGKGNKTIFYSIRKDRKHKHGVGFVVSEDTLPKLKEFKAVSDQIQYTYSTNRSNF